MDEGPEQNLVSAEFHKECSIRQAAKVLEMKQRSIYEDLGQLLNHISLLVPSLERTRGNSQEPQAQVLEEALGRLGDQAFAELVLQVMQNRR